MSTLRTFRLSTAAAAAALAAASAAARPAAAQDTTGAATGVATTTSTMVAPVLRVDTFMVLVPARGADEVRADLDRARAAVQSAQAERVRTRDLETRASGAVEVRKREIDVLKARIDLAKKEKREADRAAMEAQRKQEELRKSFAERRRGLRTSEVSLADATRERAEAAVKVYELELELGSQRAQLAGLALPAGSPEGIRRAGEIQRQEKRVLEALRTLAERTRTQADREKQVADKRIELFEAQAKLTSPD
jgi:hypothetical protein